MNLLQRHLKARFARALPPSVVINGPKPSDPAIHDERFYEAVFLKGTLGLGEAYMDGWWSCEALDVFFDQAFRAGLLEKFRYHPTMLWVRAREFLFNEQKRSRATEIAEHHYSPESEIIFCLFSTHTTSTPADIGKMRLTLTLRRRKNLI